jgi:hypothetical protein
MRAGFVNIELVAEQDEKGNSSKPTGLYSGEQADRIKMGNDSGMDPPEPR